jgi:hypothetical protein
MPVAYRYIGPEQIRQQTREAPPGAEIRTIEGLQRWLASTPAALDEGATFVVALDGVLRLAPRRSEHVACAGGEPVLAAGEVSFQRERGGIRIEATNQSTGYCPEPESFAALAAALATAGLPVPAGWSHAFLFRRCPNCALLNLVKDDDLTCVACDHSLPLARNL